MQPPCIETHCLLNDELSASARRFNGKLVWQLNMQPFDRFGSRFGKLYANAYHYGKLAWAMNRELGLHSRYMPAVTVILVAPL